MKLSTRITLIVIVYFFLLIFGYLATHSLDKELKTGRFSYDSLTASAFMDDFIRVRFSYEGIVNSTTPVNFLIVDEYNNLWHNTTSELTADKDYQIDLQPVPRDFEHNRSYIVYANFLNRTIDSGYVTVKDLPKKRQIALEAQSWLSFMVLENHLALGTYCDQQRLLWLSTRDSVYGKNFIQCQSVEISFLLLFILTIDVVFWIIFWIYKFSKSKITSK